MSPNKSMETRPEITEPIIDLVNTGLEDYKLQLDDYFQSIDQEFPEASTMATLVYIFLKIN